MAYTRFKCTTIPINKNMCVLSRYIVTTIKIWNANLFSELKIYDVFWNGGQLNITISFRVHWIIIVIWPRNIYRNDDSLLNRKFVGASNFFYKKKMFESRAFCTYRLFIIYILRFVFVLHNSHERKKKEFESREFYIKKKLSRSRGVTYSPKWSLWPFPYISSCFHWTFTLFCMSFTGHFLQASVSSFIRVCNPSLVPIITIFIFPCWIVVLFCLFQWKSHNKI